MAGEDYSTYQWSKDQQKGITCNASESNGNITVRVTITKNFFIIYSPLSYPEPL